MRIGLLAALLALALPARPSYAAATWDTTGNQFVAFCAANSEQKELCLFYVKGLWGGAIAFYPLACLPAGVDHSQLLEIGLKKIRENPEISHLEARQTLLAAWMKTFPCPKAGAK
jgi:hypothetical protein